jgi:hypothetical protein
MWKKATDLVTLGVPGVWKARYNQFNCTHEGSIGDLGDPRETESTPANRQCTAISYEFRIYNLLISARDSQWVNAYRRCQRGKSLFIGSTQKSNDFVLWYDHLGHKVKVVRQTKAVYVKGVIAGVFRRAEQG